MRARGANVIKGLAAGLIGGLVGTWIMTETQKLMSRAMSNGGQESEDSGQAASESDESATTKAASAISERVFDHVLSEREKGSAGNAVHYAFGTLMGGVYGIAAETAPATSAAAGFPFGAALWLMADEVVVPVLGLSGPPTEQPPSTDLYGLGAHLVYGFATELVRRGVRSAF